MDSAPTIAVETATKRPASPAPAVENQIEEPSAKKQKTTTTSTAEAAISTEPTSSSTPASAAPEATAESTHSRGVAPVKKEFLLYPNGRSAPPSAPTATTSDDAAEASGTVERTQSVTEQRNEKKKAKGGQNKARKFHFSHDEVKLCQSLVTVPREGLFKDTICEYAVKGAEREANGGGRGGRGGKRGGRGGRGKGRQEEEKVEAEGEVKEEGEKVPVDPKTLKCKSEHDLRTYLAAKSEDVEGVCPVFEQRGWCANGWRCRWVGSHSKEVDGELILVVDEERKAEFIKKRDEALAEKLANHKGSLGNRREVMDWEKDLAVGAFEDPYSEIVNMVPMDVKIAVRKIGREAPQKPGEFPVKKSFTFLEWNNKVNKEEREEERAAFVEAPLRPEEKRRLYFGRDTPVLAPLTTTGNLPFRRLALSLGARVTYSEMAMSTSLLQAHKPEWALLKAHTSELPNFGAQICANRLDTAIKTTEVLSSLFPSPSYGRHGLSFIDLNCGCPIDLVYKNGGGSALLDTQSKLARMLQGMNYVSGETPITFKIRTGTRDNHPTAQKLVERIVRSGDVQAITLHGRSRQQRYTRAADWSYIAETATMIKNLKQTMSDETDTAADKDRPEPLPVHFIGNGDCYSHIDYHSAITNSRVDTVMLARGALIKPWIFEEISTNQYLDKSATERLEYVKEYCRYGLECWGSDELGVATTRRFLMEWLSFTCRYVPIGILERLPPKIQDRPPAWRGRNELESLLGSTDYRDWIKISEMFLGKAPEDFWFTPKHKSNAYDDEAEG